MPVAKYHSFLQTLNILDCYAFYFFLRLFLNQNEVVDFEVISRSMMLASKLEVALMKREVCGKSTD